MNSASVDPSIPSVYYCEPCAYNCKDTRAFKKHVASTKHKKNIVTVIPAVEEYKCSFCQCIYQHKRSLTRHQKTCSEDIVNTTINAIPQHIIDTIVSRAQIPTQQQVPTVPVPARQVNAFGNENYDCVTFGGNFEILRRPVDAFEYMLDELYEDPANINIIFEDKRNYLLKYIKPDKTTEVLSLATLIKKALDQNKQKFLDYCIQHMDIVNPGSRAQDIRNYTVTEHGLYNSVTGTTELIHNNTLRDIMPDFMSNTCMNHYNRDFKELLKVKFLEIAHSSNAKLNFSGL